jgi:UDP-3-O-[3-hydroxymyristoyl] glucosamine N-acyltransferase
VIGADGFGFAPGPGGIAKVPQVGIVIIEDEVEVGAGTTIDRAAFDATVIKKGAKLDSHVHVGHNCTVGESAMLCGLAGMAGSSSIGKGSILAGHSGISNQVEVGDNIIIGTMTVATKKMDTPGYYAGLPAIPASEWRRQQVLVRKLPEMEKRLKELEKLIADQRGS